MSVSEIRLYNILRDKVGEEEAQSLVDFIQTSVKDEFSSKKDLLATKEDLANVKVDILRTIYAVGIVQFIAIVGSVLAIINFALK